MSTSPKQKLVDALQRWMLEHGDRCRMCMEQSQEAIKAVSAEKLVFAEEQRVAALLVGTEEVDHARENRHLKVCLEAALKQLHKDGADYDPLKALAELGRGLKLAELGFTVMESKLLTLLDRIEVEEDSALAKQRFDIAEEFGYTVEITGMVTSGSIN